MPTCSHGHTDACPNCIVEIDALRRRAQSQSRLLEQCKHVIDSQRGFIETCRRHRDAYRALADWDGHREELEALDRIVYPNGGRDR